MCAPFASELKFGMNHTVVMESGELGLVCHQSQNSMRQILLRDTH